MNYYFGTILDKSQSFMCKNVDINGSKYYVSSDGYRSDYSNLLTNPQEKQSCIMKTITVDNRDYYVPYGWIDCEQTRNMIRNSLK